MRDRLLLTILATVWVVSVTVAYFWIGLWIGIIFNANAAIGYWTFSWIVFGALVAAPFIIYKNLEDRG